MCSYICIPLAFISGIVFVRYEMVQIRAGNKMMFHTLPAIHRLKFNLLLAWLSFSSSRDCFSASNCSRASLICTVSDK